MNSLCRHVFCMTSSKSCMLLIQLMFQAQVTTHKSKITLQISLKMYNDYDAPTKNVYCYVLGLTAGWGMHGRVQRDEVQRSNTQLTGSATTELSCVGRTGRTMNNYAHIFITAAEKDKLLRAPSLTLGV